MKTFIEVGANFGTHTYQFIKEDSRVFCFEPSQELYYELWKKFKEHKNVMILPFAIDIDTSIKRFNVQGKYDWGCSSLYEWNDDLDKQWPNRVTDEFIFTHSYNVFTLRLDQFFKLYKITEVEFLWVDAQGNDFRVLQSAGDMINIIKEGQCESIGKAQLYKNSDNTFENIEKYLTENNFYVGGNSDNYENDICFRNKKYFNN